MLNTYEILACEKTREDRCLWLYLSVEFISDNAEQY